MKKKAPELPKQYKNRVRVNIALHPDVCAALKILADTEHQSASGLITQMILDRVKKQKGG